MLRKTVIALLFVFGVSQIVAARQGKLSISLFNIIRFRNEECATSSGRNGTCFKLSECEDIGGQPSGSCAEGHGTCCLLERTCGQTASRNITYFTSPGYPASFSGPSSCVLHVQRHPSICQLRLDMEHFEIHGPTDGNCDTDVFEVNDTLGVPSLCGDNTGQHMYLDVEHVEKALTFSMTTGETEKDRRWSIKITQIPCATRHAAPQGCLQYYTDLEGRITNFNQNEKRNNETGVYSNDLDYAICFRRQPNICSFKFAHADNETFTNQKNASIPCSTDYLQFAGWGIICGNKFDEPVRVETKSPAVLYVKSDDKDVNEGFDLNFQQEIC